MLSMFRSARLKLTLFYLAIIAVLSLFSTFGIRILAEHEYRRSNDVQRSEFRQLFFNKGFPILQREPDTVFKDVQDDEAAKVRTNLNEALLAVNILALTFGGLISYWFAGRTLQPIEEAHAAQARFTADASHELRTPLT
ncbi:MAG TPA: hypothetical protein VFK47_15290, partial [Ktedonobacteraceae bacterium]|nr:hypothetical protein [Ktedonobacteraceae bacterium]